MLNSGKEDKAIERIRELMYECGGEEDKVKKPGLRDVFRKQ